MTAEVAVAIVSWNTRDLLRRCLRSFAEEARSGRCEVWVVDNGSSDGSVEMVREEFDWVRLIESHENLGFGTAVNEIARRTKTPWIAPANADIELTDEALDALLTAASRPDIGVVAPRLVMADGATQHSIHAFPTLSLALVVAFGAYRLPTVGDRLAIEGYWNPDRRRLVDWAHGAFLLVRREAFDAAGGFDPAQWMYAEDIDLHWRVARQGWRACYEPAARVRHAVSAAAVQAFGHDRLQRHLLASYEWQFRRRGAGIAWFCALVNCLGAALRWAGFAAAALIAPRRYRSTRARARSYAKAHARALRGPRALESAVERPPG